MTGRGAARVGLRVFVPLLSTVILALPWLRHLWDAPGLEALDSLLSWQCHRLASRSWGFGGTSMAVCSRCAGIYAGIALGALLMRPRWTGRTTVLWVAGALLVLVIEAGLEWWVLLEPLHVSRFATGLALALPVASAALRLLEQPRLGGQGVEPPRRGNAKTGRAGSRKPDRQRQGGV